MAVRHIKVHGRWRWQARVAYKGARLSRVCPRRQEAKDAEAELLLRLKAEAAEAEAEGARPATLRALCEAYVADLEARGKGPETVGRAAATARALEAQLPALLDQPITKVKADDVFAFRQGRIRDGIKPGTVNRDLRSLRAMLRAARPEFRFPGKAFFPEDETRVRWLRPEEEVLVLQGVPETVRTGKRKGGVDDNGRRPVPFRDMAQLAALTLMRLSEIRLLRREQVHLEQGIVLLPRAKAGARPVVLSADARGILQRQLDGHSSDWVFPGPDGRPYSRVHVSRIFRKAARAAGLKDFRFHDLRHHGATMALNAGFTAPIVMALGGWKTERMMRRYAAVTDKTLRAAAEAVSGNGNGEWQRVANPAPALSPR